MSARWTKKRKAVLCALSCGALLLQPQGVSHAEEDFFLEEIVVTANRIPTKVSEVAANVTVITEQQLENGHYSSLGEVLRTVNGVIVTSAAYPGAAERLLINGDDRVLVMIDGRKISRPEGTANYHSNFDLSGIISLDNIERIEVVKGGASALYGSDAVGGVVNIITKKAAGSKTTLRTSIGSWGERNYGLTIQGKEKKWGWYITADKRTQGDIYYNSLAGDGAKAWPNSSYDGKSVAFRLDDTIDDNRSLTFNFEHMNDKSGQPYSLSWPSSDIASHLWNNAALTYNFNQNGTVPGEARIYSNYYSQYFQGVYKSRTTGLDYKTGWKLNDKNTFMAGGSFEKGEVLEGSGGYSHKRLINNALYVQDINKLDSKWTLTSGLRYDHYSKFGGQTTPKVNLNYSADRDTDLYLSYNKVFRAPNLDDLYYYRVENWGGITYTSSGNPDLKPEKGRIVTVGVNKRLSNSTTVGASYFNSDITDAIAWYYDPGTLITNVRNIAHEKKHGFEINATHQFSSKYFAQLGYSYLHTERDNNGGTGYQVYNGEPNGYRFKAGYNDDRWNWLTELRGATGRSDYFADRSYWVWNASVNYKASKATSLFFKVNNITNKAYVLCGSSVRGDYPMPARNYQLGIQYQF